MPSERNIYLLPGRGEQLTSELGAAVGELGFGVRGRGMAEGFDRLRFSEQLEAVKQDLTTEFWRSDAFLVGRSYGGYVLLHSMTEMPPFPGKVLLFSPVLGAAFDKIRLYGARPPRAEKLIMLSEAGQFPAPMYMEIHTGAEDNGCDPVLAEKLACLVPNSRAFVVPGAGHQWSPGYVRCVLSKFLLPECDEPATGYSF